MATPNDDYLDAFLQGARFALLAMEARLREDGLAEEQKVEVALDEFHELFHDVHAGLKDRRPLVRLVSDYTGKN